MIACDVCKLHCEIHDGSPCIKNIPLLSNLNKEEIDEISQGVTSKNYQKGDYIFRTGDKADRLYIVCSGKMKIYKYLPDGREQILYIYGAGDFVGAFNLMKEDAYKYNAVALEDTTISTLTKAQFDRVAMANPGITLKILEKSYERIRWAEDLIGMLSSSNADAKVARLLLNLIEDFGSEVSSENDDIILNLSINREEMGSFAGISRETMTRKLGKFRREGYLDFIGNKKIIIKDKDKLKEML